MPFKPGNPGKPKGAENKTKREVKEAIALFLGQKFKTIEKLYESLEPKEQADFLTKLLPYSIPKLTAMTDTQGDDVEGQTIVFKIGNNEIPFTK